MLVSQPLCRGFPAQVIARGADANSTSKESSRGRFRPRATDGRATDGKGWQGCEAY